MVVRRGPGALERVLARQRARGGPLPDDARRDAAPWIGSDATWHEAQGLCFYWARKGEERYVGHAGGLHGFITRFALSPKDGAGAIALLNGMGDATALTFELLDEVVTAQRARPLPQPEPPAPLPAPYVALLGRYHWAEFAEVFTVEWRDGQLVLVDLQEDEAYRLDPTDDPLRFIVHGGRPAGDAVRFLLGPDGRARLLNLAGYPLERQ